MMTVKGKDFKRAVDFIKDFLAKLPKDADCAQLRDSLNLTLLHMKKYFHLVWLLKQETASRKKQKELSASLVRGGEGLSLSGDGLDHFHWRWVTLDPPKVLARSLPIDDKSTPRPPLILQALEEGDVELVNQLIDKDPGCVNSQDELGRSAVMYAVHHGSDDCLEALLKRGAHVNNTSHDGMTATHTAVIHEDGPTLRLLLDHGADPAIHDLTGRTALHWAASLPLNECLQILMKCNIPLSPRDKDGLTPAMWACSYNRKPNFELLVGAEDYSIAEEDGIERDSRGRTWVHWSTDSQSCDQSCDCLKSLLTPETALLQDSSGKTALHLAAEIGAVDACKVLLREDIAPSIINMADDDGRSSLHLAVLDGHGEVANLLLEKGAVLDLKDHRGYTAMDYAVENELHYCSMILRSHDHLHKRLQKNIHNQSNKEENNNRNPSTPQSLSDHNADHPSSSPQPALFISAPPPRPSLTPKLSNLTRLVDLDEDHETAGDDNHGSEENRAGRGEGRIGGDNQEVISGEEVQYVVPEGGIVQSVETGIIGSDMQPSVQLEGCPVINGAADTSQPEVSPDSLGSNQSVDYGMDVSDIEENNNNEKGKRLEGKSSKMISPGLVSQQLSQPDGTTHHPAKTPRPPASPRNSQQVPVEASHPQKSEEHTQESQGLMLEVPAAGMHPSDQPAQLPSPRRLSPLSSTADTNAVPQVKGELRSKKKKKRNSKTPSPRSPRGDGRLELAGGPHPLVRPASPSFPLSSPRPPATTSTPPHTPLTRGRPERPFTPPPPNPTLTTGHLQPKRHSSPSPPVTPREQLMTRPQEPPNAGRLHPSDSVMRGTHNPVKAFLEPADQPSPRSPRGLTAPLTALSPTAPLTPSAPLAPKASIDIPSPRGQPFMPAPPVSRSPRH